MKIVNGKISISGTVTAVFSHRFVMESEDGKHLANIGRKGLKLITLHAGDQVRIKGDVKDASIKVAEIIKGNAKPIKIAQKGGPASDKPRVTPDPANAIAVVVKQGFELMAAPRFKAKHFENLGRSAKGKAMEFHVLPDGVIQKKTSHIGRKKWMATIPVDHGKLVHF